MKKIFFDMEFTGLHQFTTPISIGLVADTGETFYAEFSDYDEKQVDDWLRVNVISNLKFDPPPPDQDEYWSWGKDKVELRADRYDIAIYLNDWFQDLLGGPISWVDYTNEGTTPDNKGPEPIEVPCIEMWSDCLAYDWILFNQLWGGAMQAPACIHYIPQDICTVFKIFGIDPDINREAFAAKMSGKDFDRANKHNALWDAIVIKECYDALSFNIQRVRDLATDPL